MPYRIPALAGKPYTPSNGTEGEGFIERWCNRCLRDENEDCPILAGSFVEQQPEWTHDAMGEPCCTAFEEDSEEGRARRYRVQVEALGQQCLPGIPE